MSDYNNPYAVERTTFQYGNGQGANTPLPNGLILTLIKLDDTDYFELLVGDEQLGAIHRSDNPVTIAAKHLAKKENQ